MNSRAAFWSILIFGGARVLGWLRVSEELELKGMDIDKHGEAAYPAQVTIKVSNANGFYLRSIVSPVNSAQFSAIREQMRTIPRNGIPNGNRSNVYNR